VPRPLDRRLRSPWRTQLTRRRRAAVGCLEAAPAFETLSDAAARSGGAPTPRGTKSTVSRRDARTGGRAREPGRGSCPAVRTRCGAWATGLARARVERLAVRAALVWGGDVRYGTGGTWAGRSVGSLRLQPRRTLARYRSPRLDRSDPAASRGRGGIRERLEREGTANARRMGAATGKRAERKTCRYDWVTN